METQPFVIALMLLSPSFTGTTQPWPLAAYTITLLFVALHWWALWVEHEQQRSLPPQRIQFLRLVGLLAAAIITLLTHLPLLTNLLAPIVILAVVTWAWKRGLDKTRFSLGDEDLVPTFRAGFIALLILFLLTVVLTTNSDVATYGGVFVALGNAFSLFFFSGLLALSFTRIAIIRRDLARTSSNSIFDPTRVWLIVLTFAWALLLAVVIGLDTFSFQSIADFFSPLWTLLGIITIFLLQILFFLLSPLLLLFSNTLDGLRNGVHAPSLPPPSHKSAPGAPPTIPPEAILIGRIILLTILLVLFILLIRLLLRRWQARQQSDDSEEEIREMLPIRTLLQRHQQQRHPQQERIAELEPLPPGSARARYRELLQAVAEQQETLARRLNETPTEYQARLLTQLQHHAASESEHTEPLDDPATLTALTDAYTRERYGGKSTQEPEGRYSTRWIAHFIQRLLGTSQEE